MVDRLCGFWQEKLSEIRGRDYVLKGAYGAVQISAAQPCGLHVFTVVLLSLERCGSPLPLHGSLLIIKASVCHCFALRANLSTSNRLLELVVMYGWRCRYQSFQLTRVAKCDAWMSRTRSFAHAGKWAN